MPHGGSVATYEDVTQTVHAEEALRDYAARLERSNRELQDLASIASHYRERHSARPILPTLVPIPGPTLPTFVLAAFDGSRRA
jgi:hypothetical protein